MKVAESDVLHVAELANLELTPSERQRMVRDLNSILGYVERLNDLDTANVPPVLQVQVSDRTLVDAPEVQETTPDRFATTMRDDVPQGLRKSLDRAEALQNAPETDGTFFKVPKVIERLA
jgi:aspartyl-tRNA(Asn)/glutamyl-tRNA(Gln) amidotransferase subunit C